MILIYKMKCSADGFSSQNIMNEVVVLNQYKALLD